VGKRSAKDAQRPKSPAWRLGRELERAAPAGKAPSEALAAYRRAVELGDYDSVPWAVNLANSGGDGFKPDPAEAWRLAQAGVAAGNHASMRTAAVLLLGKQKLTDDEQNQVVAWLQTASATDTMAAAQLARMYYYGRGVNTDYARAVELAERVLPKAPKMFEMVRIMAAAKLEGYAGQTKDVPGAIAMLERAAGDGLVEAARELAFWYSSGAFGVPRSPAAERQWRERSARLGSVEEAAWLARDYRRDQPPNLTKAAEFYELASRLGDGQSAAELARLWSTGGGGLVARPAEARQQAKRAAELGFKPGQMLYAQFLIDGLGGSREPAEGARWMNAAAEEHYPPAQYAYGLMQLNGTGVPKDERQGVEWVSRAAASEEPAAMLLMGESHVNGRFGLAPNPELGRAYLLEAAKTSDPEVSASAKKLLAQVQASRSSGNLGDLRINQPSAPKSGTSIYDWLSITSDPVSAGAGDSRKTQ
jgi:hypothetical protein